MRGVLSVCVCVLVASSVQVKSEVPEEQDRIFRQEKLRDVSEPSVKQLKKDLDYFDGLGVQEIFKLGRIVVPDLPEEESNFRYQVERTLELEDNDTNSSDTFTQENVTNKLPASEVFTTTLYSEDVLKKNAIENEVTLGEIGIYSYSENRSNENIETSTGNPIVTLEKTLSDLTMSPSLNKLVSITRKNCTSRKTSPRIDEEMVKRAFKEDQNVKIGRFLAEEQKSKKFEKRTFNVWNLLDFGGEEHESVVKITKEVPLPVPYPVEKKIPFPVKVEVDRPIAVEVPKPYPVTFEKKVFFPIKEYIHAPYPVYKKVPFFIQVPVDRPVPVRIPKPYPVYIEKKIPFPVEKHIPIPIKVPVDQPIPVHVPFVRNIYYPVEKKVRYPVPISVEKPIAVPVEKPYPVYVEVTAAPPVQEHFPESRHEGDHKIDDSALGQNHQIEVKHTGTESFQTHKSGHSESHSASARKFSGFVPSRYSSSVEHDHTQLQRKKDDENTEIPALKPEEKMQGSTTTTPPKEEKTKQEDSTSKSKIDYEGFGKKKKTK